MNFRNRAATKAKDQKNGQNILFSFLIKLNNTTKIHKLLPCLPLASLPSPVLSAGSLSFTPLIQTQGTQLRKRNCSKYMGT